MSNLTKEEFIKGIVEPIMKGNYQVMEQLFNSLTPYDAQLMKADLHRELQQNAHRVNPEMQKSADFISGRLDQIISGRR
jgi:dGTP triphosphohydrolase